MADTVPIGNDTVQPSSNWFSSTLGTLGGFVGAATPLVTALIPRRTNNDNGGAQAATAAQEAARQQDAAASKKTLIYAGIGLAVAALLGLGLILILRPSKN